MRCIWVTRCATLASLLLTQLLTHVHQDASQHVLAFAVTAITPVIIVVGVFDDLRGSVRQQQFLQFVVLRKLGHHRFSHHIDLRGFPIPSQRSLTITAHPRR